VLRDPTASWAVGLRTRIIGQHSTRHHALFRTLSIVVSIGLADSVNASTIGPALFFAGGEHPRWSVLEFTLGILAVFLLGGALLVLGPGQALLALVPHPSRTTRYIIETAAGLVMLIAAGVLWTRRRSLSRKADEDRKRRETRRQTADSKDGPGGNDQDSNDGGRKPRRRSPALIGAGIAAVELPTAFPYFAAQKLARIRAQFEAHWPAVAAAAALLAGSYVTALGLTGLASGASGRNERLARRIRHVIAR
jgi:hypothetical protein